jgi:hypothetical protein
MPSAAKQLQSLSHAWNEPEISLSAIQRWLTQFPAEDQAIAIRLLECMELHSWARMLRECRLLHQRLCMDLRDDGFDVEKFSDIDFTRAFVCKSGDMASYVYRKANRLSVNHFKTIEALHQSHLDRSKRAIVILDDYIGTGSQFIFQFLGRSEANTALISAYKRARLCSLVVHDDARTKWRLLQRHCIEDVMAIEERQLECVDFRLERKALIQTLSRVDWRKAGLIAAQRDFPVMAHPALTAEERITMRQFLNDCSCEEEAGTTEFLLGHHSFFYGAPNALARVLLPLFKRVEDFTIYPKESLRGLPAEIIDYDIENPEPITPL